MYTPPFNRLDDEAELRAMVAATGSAQLITGGDGYPSATLLPVVWDGDVVTAHFARANPHWEQIGDGTPTLLVVTGPEAYISPSWYAAKAEHGRVVPTWNYAAVHLAGRVRVVTEETWLRRHLDALVDHHEAHREQPWHTGDAPAAYISGQLRGIVGVEVAVERVEGKRKWSQNRSEADRRGVVAGLRAGGAEAMAEAVESTLG